MTEKTLTYDTLDIPHKAVYKQMGYRDATPDAATQAETQAVIEEVRPWLKPRCCYFVSKQLQRLEALPTTGLQRLEALPTTELQRLEALPTTGFSFGDIILKQLRGSEAYALFVCTAGVEFEAYQQQLKQQGDMLRVFIADALGSVIAERCADRMEQHLQQSIDKLGWHHTNRFSPGYCGWHVSEQQLLFPLFQGHTCGVTLNDSSLMVPIKSVSGIIGIGRNVRHLDYTCGLCDYQQCLYNK